MGWGAIRRIPHIPKIPAKAGIHLLLWPYVREDRCRDGPLPQVIAVRFLLLGSCAGACGALWSLEAWQGKHNP